MLKSLVQKFLRTKMLRNSILQSRYPLLWGQENRCLNVCRSPHLKEETSWNPAKEYLECWSLRNWSNQFKERDADGGRSVTLIKNNALTPPLLQLLPAEVSTSATVPYHWTLVSWTIRYFLKKQIFNLKMRRINSIFKVTAENGNKKS